MGVLEYIALVAQLLGLDAVKLIVLAAYLLRIPQCEAECAKLEECAPNLRALLRCGDVAMQLVEKDGALVETDVLLRSYRGSSLWCLIRTGRTMLAQLRDMQDRLNSLCDLVLRELVRREHTNVPTDHPASDTNAMDHHVIGGPLHCAETCDSASDSQRYSGYSGTSQGGADDQSDSTEPGGLESV